MERFLLPAALLVFTAGRLSAVEAGDPVVTPVLPVKIESRGGDCFADFGEAAYGNLQITFKGRVPAGKFTVLLGEKLAANGKIDRKPPGSVNFREIEVTTLEGKNVYQLEIPTKGPHKGGAVAKMPPAIGEVTPFRYVEIEKSPLPLDKDSLRQLAVNAPFDDKASSFECSDATLNAVWNLCKHTMKATTAFGIYIDGERERLAYEGDAYINLLSHYACDLDPRVARRTFGQLLAHPTWPTEWSLQMPMIAEADYQATGETVLAERDFEAIKRKLLMEKAREDGLLRISAIVDWPQGERDNYNEGVADPGKKQQVGPQINTVANAFYHRSLVSVATLAKALGKKDEARDLEARAEQVRRAFNTVFFDEKRGIYLDGEGSGHASLHANMFPLAFGLVPPERQAKVADFIRSRGMACSVYGAQFLLEALYQAGRGEDALALMTARGERGWWHMIEQGSTMTLEAWDAKAKPNLTWNHAWGSAPANQISRHLLGVRPLTPGYAEILIAPQPGSLKWARGKVPTPHGPVGVSWQNDGRPALQIEVPTGAVARVVFPGKANRAETVSVDGKPVEPELIGGELVIGNLAPGRHVIFRPGK